MADPRPGYFVLRSSIRPALPAGEYTLEVTQDLLLSDTSLTGADPIPASKTTLDVVAPRYLLPPAEILSTFPPNQAVGAFSSRLPQIVIRRRTLPWERPQAGAPFPETPWLALVVLTFEEGDVVANRPLAEAVTAPTTLPGSWKDADAATVLQVRRSVVQRVFPAADELHLLTHVRQVHLSDTELALGDDDGWMAVIVANQIGRAHV